MGCSLAVKEQQEEPERRVDFWPLTADAAQNFEGLFLLPREERRWKAGLKEGRKEGSNCPGQLHSP